MLFVFVNTVATAAALVESRGLGVSRRMLAPTSTSTLLAGEALGRFAVALVQAVLILAVGALLFGVDWGDPLGAAALVVVFVLVATGAGMLVGAVARTGDQAERRRRSRGHRPRDGWEGACGARGGGRRHAHVRPRRPSRLSHGRLG